VNLVESLITTPEEVLFKDGPPLSYGRVLKPFQGTESGQLSLLPGDIVYVFKRTSTHAWGDVNRTIGHFPLDDPSLLTLTVVPMFTPRRTETAQKSSSYIQVPSDREEQGLLSSRLRSPSVPVPTRSAAKKDPSLSDSVCLSPFYRGPSISDEADHRTKAISSDESKSPHTPTPSKAEKKEKKRKKKRVFPFL
jgi:hypothetical protein